MERIILVGYMGSGKTTLGRQLARALELEFYDLDWYIETRYRCTVAQIFAQKGEEGFREMERSMLHEVAEFENIVLSCGGGTPCFYDNMDYLNQQGDTVYLKATPEVLAQHLTMGRVERPLIKGKSNTELLEYIQQSLCTREPFYSKAKNILDVNLLDNRTKIQDSVKLLCKTLHLTYPDIQQE